MKKIAIVGGGPSAMFAIMACKDLGIKPDLWSKGLTCQQGAFWFHWVPPAWESVTERVKITVTSVGTRQGYILKQWRNYSISKRYESSFPILEHDEFGYNPLSFVEKINNPENFVLQEINSGLRENELLQLADSYDLIFHSFPTERARINNRSLIAFLPVVCERSEHPVDLYTEYNGLAGVPISRSSNLWGWKFNEYLPVYSTDQFMMKEERGKTISFIQDLVPSIEPTYMFPLSERVIPIGRLARFDRKALSHDAYDLVRGYVENI